MSLVKVYDAALHSGFSVASLNKFRDLISFLLVTRTLLNRLGEDDIPESIQTVYTLIEHISLELVHIIYAFIICSRIQFAEFYKNLPTTCLEGF